MLRNLLAFTLTATLVSTASADLITQIYNSDLEANDAILSTAFVAEGRIGDRGGAATFELDLGPETSAPAATAQYAWPNGADVGFSLSYDSLTDLVTYVVGNNTLEYTASGVINDIFIRTRAVNADTSVTIANLQLDGQLVNTDVTAIGNGATILQISGGDLAEGFTLTGTSNMAWTGDAPRNSRLAYQLKIGEAVPEPGSLALLACGALVLIRRR